MEHIDPPWITLYAWDISHALATLYHPYAHKPSALTEYLKQKLREQHVKWDPTQVKLNLLPEHNINLDLPTLATTTLKHLGRRGECNVPKQYLKGAEWVKEGPLGIGYYATDPDKVPILIPIDFNFKTLQWGVPMRKTIISSLKDQPLSDMDSSSLTKKELQIEAVGAHLMEPQTKMSPSKQTSNSEATAEGTPQIQTSQKIPLNRDTQEEESKLAALAQLIPSHISKPPIQPHLLAGAMAQIATTTTLASDSLVARTLGTGISQWGTSSSVEGILQLLFPSQHNWGNGSGDDPSEPNRWNTGKCLERGDRGGGDGDNPRGSCGGGRGGGGGKPNP